MSTRKRAWEWVFVGALCCYGLVLGGWLLRQPMPPLQDYLEWVYQGWIGARLALHDARVTQSFQFVRVPVPNELSQFVLGLMELVVRPVAAARVFVVGLLLGSMVICWKAAKRLSPEHFGAIFVVLFFCFFANTNFWNGYINYQLSMMLLLAFLLMQERLNAVWVGVFGTALFFCHASTFLAFVLLGRVHCGAGQEQAVMDSGAGAGAGADGLVRPAQTSAACRKGSGGAAVPRTPSAPGIQGLYLHEDWPVSKFDRKR